MEINLELQQCGPNAWCARLVTDSLSGYDDELGADDAESPTAAIEAAAERAYHLLKTDPELAALVLPMVGPELSAVIAASRYIDAPEILRTLPKHVRKNVKRVAKELKRTIGVARKVGGAATSIGKALTKGVKVGGYRIRLKKFW